MADKSKQPAVARAMAGKKRMPAQERKIQIMEETLKLIAKKGFEGTKTKNIADACGVSEAAIFKLFKSKEEMLFASIAYKFGTPKKELITKVKFDPKRPELAMKLVAEDMFKTVENNMDLARVLILTLIEHPECIREHIKKTALSEKKLAMEVMTKGLMSGLYKKMDVEIVATLFPISMLGTIVTQLLIQGKKLTKKQREKMIDQVIEVYLHGVMK